MALKIEKTRRANGEWDEFLEALHACKEVGDSFVVTRCDSNHRLALRIAQRWLGAHFRTSTEGKGQIRVVRIG